MRDSGDSSDNSCDTVGRAVRDGISRRARWCDGINVKVFSNAASAILSLSIVNRATALIGSEVSVANGNTSVLGCPAITVKARGGVQALALLKSVVAARRSGNGNLCGFSAASALKRVSAR